MWVGTVDYLIGGISGVHECHHLLSWLGQPHVRMPTVSCTAHWVTGPPLHRPRSPVTIRHPQLLSPPVCNYIPMHTQVLLVQVNAAPPGKAHTHPLAPPHEQNGSYVHCASPTIPGPFLPEALQAVPMCCLLLPSLSARVQCDGARAE